MTNQRGNTLIPIALAVAVISAFTYYFWPKVFAQTVPDTVAPTVSITTPAPSSSTVSGLIDVAAQASDNVAVSKVEFYTEGRYCFGCDYGNVVLFATASASPYTAKLDTTRAPFAYARQIMAVAYDASGNKSDMLTNIVPITIKDITPPTVSIISPLSGSTTRAGSTITVTIEVSDNASAISGVKLYINNNQVCTWGYWQNDSSNYQNSQYPQNKVQGSCSWTVPTKPNITYSIQAKATDSDDSGIQPPSSNTGSSPIVKITSGTGKK